MMYRIIALAISLSSIGSYAGPINNERQVPGKCTIGWDHRNTDIPGGTPVGGGDGNSHLQSSYAFIVGADNVQTNFPVDRVGDSYDVVADGGYGGPSGGTWHIDSRDPLAATVEYCVISFVGRSDQPDQTFDSRNAPEGTCDLYKNGGAFTAASGCRCRFDCQ